MSNIDFFNDYITIKLDYIDKALSVDKGNMERNIDTMFEHLFIVVNKYGDEMEYSLKKKNKFFQTIIKLECARQIYKMKTELNEMKTIALKSAEQLRGHDNESLKRLKKKIEEEVLRTELTLENHYEDHKKTLSNHMEHIKKSINYPVKTLIHFINRCVAVEAMQLKKQEHISRYSAITSEVQNVIMRVHNQEGSSEKKLGLIGGFIEVALKQRWVEEMGRLLETIYDLEKTYLDKINEVERLHTKMFEDQQINRHIRSYYGVIFSEIKNLLISLDRLINHSE